MTKSRLALAATLAVAAIGSAAPAQAAAEDRCDVRLERLESRFYDVADKRGYEAATEWWQVHWKAYYQSCG